MPGSGPRPLVLASASPRRRELLAALGLTFSVAPADLDEVALGNGLSPDRAALVVASAKAAKIARTGDTVLAADTVVVLDGHQLGKPGSPAEAREMLAALRGRSHDVVTGVAVRADETEHTVLRRSTVRMRAYERAEIEEYVATGSALDKAGAYGIQDEPFRPVLTIEGCWCNVMGLPLWSALRLLEAAGCRAARRPDQAFARCASCPLVREEPA